MADQPVPMPPTPDDAVPDEEADALFDVVRRGYDRDQVSSRLRELGDRIHELESRIRAGSLPDAPSRPTDVASADPLAGVAEHIRGLVESFDHEIERQRRKAELEATVVVAEARTEAAQMRIDARAAEEEALAEAERMLKVAHEDAESLRRDAFALRETTLNELREIRDRMRTSLFELESGLPEDVHGGRVIVLEDSQARPGSSGPPPP